MNYKNKLFYLLICLTTVLSCKQSVNVNESKIVESPEVIEKEEPFVVPKKDKSLEKWVKLSSGTRFEIHELPFLFDLYYENNTPETTYTYYRITDKLEDFLKKSDYEGESYECFVLPSVYKFNVFLVNVARGDSNYYLLISANSYEINDMQEIGHIGDENDITTFDINKDYIIKVYNGFRDEKVFLKELNVSTNGEFVIAK
ncbi:hypothetical protein [Pseudotamlana carrageenivorans]|uniref:Lipoprotein n=1 Tax=Pseudotamlana carrageenivorans TaxID=2069432 RepID=A0A2I7SIF1_9FLAO|nr:hypothetical protein [Tamlana carrageenivorans]AUS05683.1 hypothetical protein C1A40_09500 [Tamlana carrageenivorans]